jgi:hypothetical protein
MPTNRPLHPFIVGCPVFSSSGRAFAPRGGGGAPGQGTHTVCQVRYSAFFLKN